MFKAIIYIILAIILIFISVKLLLLKEELERKTLRIKHIKQEIIKNSKKLDDVDKTLASLDGSLKFTNQFCKKMNFYMLKK